MPSFDLRDATDDDLELTYRITENAMRGYVEQTWGRWDPGEQLQKHRDNYTPASHCIIMVDDAVAGLVAVEDLPTHLWLVKLYLLASHRSRGVGTRVLEGVIRRAAGLGKPVQLRVLRVNTGAQSFYARHGFKVIDESAERLFMQRPA